MATNEILKFCQTGTNITSQVDYASSTELINGVQPGKASSKLANKTWKQTTTIVSGLAQFLADNQANNITDLLSPSDISTYTLDALTSSLGVTPPQFDNSTALATTEFVRKNNNQATGIFNLSTSTALTINHVGALIRYDGVGAATFTLPNSNGLDNVSRISIINASSGILTINPSVGNTINQGGTLASITLLTGDMVELQTTSVSNWTVISGTGAARASGSFESTVASGKYSFRHPSGMLIQVGNTGSIPANIFYRFFFAKAFASSNIFISCVCQSAATSGNYFAWALVPTTTYVDVCSNVAGGIQVTAIGI